MNPVERWRYQRETINQLHFVYQWLQRTLPQVARRVQAASVEQVLAEHRLRVQRIGERLGMVASDHGHTPRPSFSERANALVSEFYSAERKATPAERAGAVVKSLQAVREYLLETWARLNDALTAEEERSFRDEVKAMMQQEEELYRELVELRLQVQHPR